MVDFRNLSVGTIFCDGMAIEPLEFSLVLQFCKVFPFRYSIQCIRQEMNGLNSWFLKLDVWRIEVRSAI